LRIFVVITYWVDFESPPVRKFVLKVYGPQTYKVENHCSRPLSSA